MKNLRKIQAMTAMLALMLTMALGGCDDDEPEPDKRMTSYDLVAKDVTGVTGKVTFTEFSSTVTIIDIEVVGSGSSSHPAHIHLNSVATGGSISITLSPVVNGYSSTTVTKLDNNTAINYEQLIIFDGYLSVHQSSSNLSTIVAVADIGGNALTASSKSYNLSAVNTSDVNGSVLFQKRVNGNSLVTISLTGTNDGNSHPVVIRSGSIESVGGGPIVATLNPVNGTSGQSSTDLRTLTNGIAVSYDQWLAYSGYMSIQESELMMEVTLCHGNIGSN
jgi:hypothetical protein